ncbi:MAG: DUF2721 domain-containing protein [Chloroflexota bacterium]
MGEFNIWLAPLILLPGIGLMIMSTAARFGQLQTQIVALSNQMQSSTGESVGTMGLAKSLRFRGHLFRVALLGFYISAGMFTLASTLNGINGLLPVQLPLSMVVFTTVLGFVALLVAGVALFVESFSATDIVDAHYTRLMK